MFSSLRQKHLTGGYRGTATEKPTKTADPTRATRARDAEASARTRHQRGTATARRPEQRAASCHGVQRPQIATPACAKQLLRTLISLTITVGSLLLLALLSEAPGTAAAAIKPSITYEHQQHYAYELHYRAQGHADALPSRLSKRWISEQHYKEQLQGLRTPWLNPCGGVYEESTEKRKRSSRQKVLRQLCGQLTDYLSTIPVNATAVNIADIAQFTDRYRSLPRLNSTAKFSLQRVYQQLQVGVAAIAQELRTQLQWEHSKEQRSTKVSQELQQLQHTERNILCEVEVALNQTMRPKLRRRRFKRLVITPKRMRHRLDELTNRSVVLPAAADNLAELEGEQVRPLNQVELKFVKYRTLRYTCDVLRQLSQLLAKQNIAAKPQRCIRSKEMPAICKLVRRLQPQRLRKVQKAGRRKPPGC